MKSGELKSRLKNEILIFDGATGTELYRRNFFVNTSYEGLNLSSPKVVLAIHQAYADAGCDVLTTNTYKANEINLAEFGLAEKTDEINETAVALARKAVAGQTGKLIAGSIGPMPKNASLAASMKAMKRQMEALIRGGADFIIFESVESLAELKLILFVWDKPDFAWLPSFTFDENGLLADGSGIADILTLLRTADIQPDAFGLNCGKGPEATLEALQKIMPSITLPVVVQPAAGVPKSVDNRFIPMTTPEYFTTYCIRYTNLGARCVGGCCGISPEHIADLVRSLKPLAKAEHAAALKIEFDESALLDPVPTEKKSPFGRKLKEGKWVKLLEMTPPRGYDLTDTIAKAIQAKEAGFDAINLPDGPRASCRISQVITATEIQKQAGIETIPHCCCRDRNLISLQSMILGCMAEHLNNILFITGDPPKLGDYPFSSGVFDVDSIGMVKLQSRLNRGIDVGGQPLGPGVQTSIVSGVGADPNAIDPEREYRRLAEKIEAGAEFIITQPVFDPEKLIGFLNRIHHFGVPVIAGVWPFVSYRNAEFMKKEVPGVVVPDWIMDAMRDAGDKPAQRAEGIQIARKILSEIRSEVQGVATSAPFGRVNTAIAVCEGF